MPHPSASSGTGDLPVLPYISSPLWRHAAPALNEAAGDPRTLTVCRRLDHAVCCAAGAVAAIEAIQGSRDPLSILVAIVDALRQLAAGAHPEPLPRPAPLVTFLNDSETRERIEAKLALALQKVARMADQSCEDESLLTMLAGAVLETTDVVEGVAGSDAAYAEFEALIGSVESGAVAPLRGSWVVALWQRGGRLARRQDLPREAFWSAAELRAIVEAARAHFEDAEAACSALGYLFCALSYRWLAKGQV